MPPSTGEDSQRRHTDTENELLRTVGPYDDDVIESVGLFDVPAGHVIVPQHSFDQEPAATDAPDVADQRQEATSANVAGTEPDMVDTNMQVSFTEPESSTVATEPKLLSAKAADVTPLTTGNNDSGQLQLLLSSNRRAATLSSDAVYDIIVIFTMSCKTFSRSS